MEHPVVTKTKRETLMSQLAAARDGRRELREEMARQQKAHNEQVTELEGLLDKLAPQWREVNATS
jgi:predicted  nucleic acid-binding Zn-ribbon protein